MKNVNDGLQGGNITSKESSKTDTLLFSKKGVQQQSDTATLSSSSTNATSTTNTEQQVVQQQTDVATHGVIHATQDLEMKDVNNELHGEKNLSTESSKTVSSSSFTTDKSPEVSSTTAAICCYS